MIKKIHVMYGATLSIFIASCKTFHSNVHLYEKVMLPLLLVITLKFGKKFKAPRPWNISNFEINGTPKLQMIVTFSKCKHMGQYVTPIFITHSKIFLNIYQSSDLTWFALPNCILNVFVPLYNISWKLFFEHSSFCKS